MGRNKNLYYIYINLSSIAIYCFIFIKSIIDGRFIESVGDKEVFNVENLIGEIIFFLIFIGLLILITLAFRKLKLLIPYIIFTIISCVSIIAALFSGNGGSWLYYKWYDYLDIQFGIIILVFFPIILVISLLVKWVIKKLYDEN